MKLAKLLHDQDEVLGRIVCAGLRHAKSTDELRAIEAETEAWERKLARLNARETFHLGRIRALLTLGLPVTDEEGLFLDAHYAARDVAKVRGPGALDDEASARFIRIREQLEAMLLASQEQKP